MAIQFLKPGLLTSLQDRGRFLGMQDGIPISGAMDQNLLKAVNKSLGNDQDSAALEIFMQPTSLEFTKRTYFSVGAYAADLFLNKEKIDPLRAYLVEPGDVFRIQKLHKAVWSYLAVKGGFQSEEVLGSRSFHKSLHMETCKGENGFVRHEEFKGKIKRKKIEVVDLDDANMTLKCVALPEFEHLSETVKYQLLNAEFTLSKQSNRMAYRLQERLGNNLSEITTAAVLPGTVQLTSGGFLMILMRDSQVTGGYPRILQLTESSLSQLSQMRPHAQIKFELSEEF
ncbi:MAG: biotin-dependent carboxyltransferase family protein [Flavobacteriaceae bacterium]